RRSDWVDIRRIFPQFTEKSVSGVSGLRLRRSTMRLVTKRNESDLTMGSSEPIHLASSLQSHAVVCRVAEIGISDILNTFEIYARFNRDYREAAWTSLFLAVPRLYRMDELWFFGRVFVRFAVYRSVASF